MAEISRSDWEQAQAQIAHLSAQLAQLRHQPPALPSNVKVPPPPSFQGEQDGDTVKNFVDALDTWFDLVQMVDSQQKARFASTLLQDQARTWFTTQTYDMHTLRWHFLRSDLLQAFRPSDFNRLARDALYETKQHSQDVENYIAQFRNNLNRCNDVTDTEAKFLFEKHLWNEVRQQVYHSKPQTLAESMNAAQHAGSILRATRSRHKKPKFAPYIPPSDSSNTRVAGGFAPMVLGNAAGQAAPKEQRTCYICGKQGHIARNCRYRPQVPQQQNNNGGRKQKQNGGKGKGKLFQMEQQVKDLNSAVATMLQVMTASQQQGNGPSGSS